MHNPPLHAMDYVGPVLGAAVFVSIMSFVREPARLRINAIFLAGALGVYLSGGLGPWELLFPLVAFPVAYRAQRSYRWIGVAWLMHAAWDVVHHLYGNAVWPFMPTSSFGCLIFDTLLAAWCLAGAPSLLPWRNRPMLQVAGSATASRARSE